MHTTLSNRARRQRQLTAAAFTALVATFAIAGSAGATSRVAGSADPQRISIQTDAVCPGEGNAGWLDVIYDDAADGHVPQSGHEELLEGSTVVWSADGLYQENGDYFNTRVFSDNTTFNPGATWNPSGTYAYAVTISYDDGVTQTQSVTVDMTDCRAQQAPTPPTTAAPTTPTTTTAPGGTLPVTGSSNLTWIIGSLAGLIMTAGAVLFAGTRRSRIDGHR